MNRPPNRCRIVLISPPGGERPTALPAKSSRPPSPAATSPTVLTAAESAWTRPRYQAFAERIVPTWPQAGRHRRTHRRRQRGSPAASRPTASMSTAARTRSPRRSRAFRRNGRRRRRCAKTRDDALELGEERPDYIFFGRFGYDNKPEPHQRNLSLGQLVGGDDRDPVHRDGRLRSCFRRDGGRHRRRFRRAVELRSSPKAIDPEEAIARANAHSRRNRAALRDCCDAWLSRRQALPAALRDAARSQAWRMPQAPPRRADASPKRRPRPARTAARAAPSHRTASAAPPADAAYGAFQRGLYITALQSRHAARRSGRSGRADAGRRDPVARGSASRATRRRLPNGTRSPPSRACPRRSSSMR